MSFDIYDLISTDNYICINRDVAKVFGIECAVLLGELASEFKYFEARGELKDGMFFSSVANLEERTGLNKYKQSKCFKELQEKGIVRLKYNKRPNLRYIELNGKALQEEVVQKSKILTSRSQKFKPLEVKNLNLYKNNNIKNNNIKNIYSQDCTAIIDHLNSLTGKRFTDCESNVKGIRARLKEGFTKEDCFKVIENKVREWSSTEMEKYLRPSTLFRPSNFEAYLNENQGESFNDRYKASQIYTDAEIEKAIGGF